ncbi:unnamed protein product [Peronospora farinosa]|uniref:RxLR effector protein n=1 Tax=Peronospora farinosa TaxID=134698 RepID=A0AAV0UBC6_9STRA|nr:unnamed protein product [Peronospora farinosa]CAI5733373.1 unnamed protein product [Peronospora farinosa]
MRFSILVAPVVAAFVASCSSFVSAEVAALDGYTYDGKEVVRRLREDSDVQEERYPGIESIKNGIARIQKSVSGKLNIGPESEPLLQSAAALDHSPAGKELENINSAHPTSEQKVEGQATAEENKPPPLTPSEEKPPHESQGKKEEKEQAKSPPKLEEDEKISDKDVKVWNEFVENLKPEHKDLLKKRKINVELIQKGDTNEVLKVMDLVVKGTKKERGFWTKFFIYCLYAIGLASFIFVVIQFITLHSKPRASV